jgi:hypothetical protein
MVVGLVFIILEKMYSPTDERMFLIGSASGFSLFHYTVGWSVGGQSSL